VVGHILYGHDTAALGEQVWRVQAVIVSLLLAGAAAVCALLAWLVRRLVVGPLEEMSLVAGRMSERDLAARAGKRADDELGRLADSLNLIGANLAAVLQRVRGVARDMGRIIERLAQTGAQVAQGTGTVSARVAETSDSMTEMAASLQGIAAHVEALARSAEDSSASILEMATTNDQVAENVRALAQSVEETTAAIGQMAPAIQDVARNVEELSAAAEETSASMNEMDVTISQVESNAKETARLSEQAVKDAELGTESLSRTLLHVIDDVAEQTNLLALNAAILAAQSGEHGKGFAVVADEIKDLAERTGASTKEISELIRSVQDESAAAVAAMDRGVKDVEEGVRLGAEAERTLKQIQASSRQSTLMVKAIARATLEQAHGSKQVTTAINRIAETVQQIATATAEQARGSEQIMRSAEKMRVTTRHVERSSLEQARGSKQASTAIQSINEMVHHLNRAQQEQAQGSAQVVTAVHAIRGVAEAQASSMRDLEATILDLTQQAGVLRGEVERFGV
jgi:methyl-accepting chemotaxis protein